MKKLLFVALLLAMVATQAGAGRLERFHKWKLRGHIVAFRPIERIFQVVSFAPNLEILLYQTGENSPRFVLISYEHFGYSEIPEDFYTNPHDLVLRGARDKSCDQTYGNYMAASEQMAQMWNNPMNGPENKKEPAVRMDKIAFVGAFNGLPADSCLKCYIVGNGDVVIDNAKK
jgi:hypothetical protein